MRASTARASRVGLQRLTVLSAELRWRQGGFEGAPISVPYEALRGEPLQVVLGVRVQRFSGAMPKAIPSLVARVQEVLSAARKAGLSPAIELDFDARTVQLKEYARWLQAVRKAIAPTPLSFTALPAWLGAPAMKPLVRAAPEFTLQLHQLTRPSSPDRLRPLTEPTQAWSWIRSASALGHPFWIALGTYSYTLAFDAEGRYLGGRAEQGGRWPVGTLLRRLDSNPKTMAALRARLKVERPAGLRGVMWYRLPVEQDQLNWRWPTFEAVLRNEPLRPALRVMLKRRAPKLYDVLLLNEGTQDATSKWAVKLEGPKLLADAVGDAVFTPQPGGGVLQGRARIFAHDALVVGWVRTASPAAALSTAL